MTHLPDGSPYVHEPLGAQVDRLVASPVEGRPRPEELLFEVMQQRPDLERYITSL